jgi:flagellar hook-associated protein 1 FlgK
VDVQVGGQPLVTGNTAYPVAVTGSTDLDGAATDPVLFTVGGTAVTLSAGEVGATQQLLGTTLPGYLSRLDSFVATMATVVNTQHAQGVDLDGMAGGPVFTGTTAATLQVAISDPRRLASADPAKGGLDNTNANALASLDMGASTYRDLVTGFGITVSSARQLAANQAVLSAQVDASREALSGISIDEEMVNLLAAQRGYEGASRVLTALDSVLDTLINRTGLVR